MGTSLNWVDLVLAVIVVGNVLLGIRRGILREALNLVGIAVGLFAGLRLYEELGWNLEGWFDTTTATANLAAFVAVFLICALGAEYIGYLLQKGARRLWVGWLDRLAGGVFGCARGLVAASVAALVLALFPFVPRLERDLGTSVLGPYIVRIAPALYGSAMKKIRGEGYEGMDLEQLLDEYTGAQPAAAPTAEGPVAPAATAESEITDKKEAAPKKVYKSPVGSD